MATLRDQWAVQKVLILCFESVGNLVHRWQIWPPKTANKNTQPEFVNMK